MRLRRMLVLCLAIVPDGPDGYGPVVACRDVRYRDYDASLSDLG